MKPYPMLSLFLVTLMASGACVWGEEGPVDPGSPGSPGGPGGPGSPGGPGGGGSDGCQNPPEVPNCESEKDSKCPKEKDAECPTEANSRFEPNSLSYIHDAVLYQPSDRSGGQGCSPCSVGKSSGSMPGNLPSLVIKRHLRGRNGNEKGGSLGKDFFLSTDFIVRLDASASGEIALSEFDPGVNTFKHPFSERRVASDPIDGILFDNVRRSRDARVYDAVGSLTANLAQAAKVVVTDNNGSVREYEIIDTRIATSARFARLVRQ